MKLLQTSKNTRRPRTMSLKNLRLILTDKVPVQTWAALALGAVCQITQIILLREFLMVFHGNELSIGIILACWMLWVGVGSRLAAVLLDWFGRPRLILLVCAAGVFVTFPVTVFLVRVSRGFFDVLPGAYLSFIDTAIACLVLLGPVCVLFGAYFVALTRLWREARGFTDTSAAEKTYALEAVGNAFGGVAFTFVLVHLATALQVALMAGVLIVAAGLWLTRPRFGDNAATKLPIAPIVLVLLLASAVFLPFIPHLDARSHTMQWRFFAPEQELVETHQSKYGIIAVVRRQDQYSFYQSGHLAFSTAGRDAPSEAFEEQPGAQFAHFSLVQHANPKRILLIGGGLRGTLREILRHPVESVDYVELDPVLTEVARKHVSATTLAALDSPRVRLLHTDGRLFVKAAEQTYDMIIVDVPDPTTAVLNRYYTVEFFREVERRLAPDGVFVTAVVSAADLRGSAVVNRNATVYHSMKQVFSEVLPVGERVLHFFATNASGQVSADTQLLVERYRERGIVTEAFSEGHFYRLLQEGPLLRVNWILRNHGRTPDAHLRTPDTGPMFPPPLAEQEAEEAHLPPVEQRFFINSDLRPIGYYYTLVFWNVISRTRHTGALDWILHVKSWWIVPATLAVLLAGALCRIAGQWSRRHLDTHYAVLLAVFTTGSSTMLLQVALLFSFQSVYGFVYEMIGLIAAVFMTGLALGAAFTHRFLIDKSNLRTLALIQLLIAVFAALIAGALALAGGMTSPVAVFILFMTVTFVAGLLNGADFPLATACYMKLTARAEKSTGIVYGVELLGACCGAIVAGVVLVPVLGIPACCLLASIVNAAAAIVAAISRRFNEHTRPA